MFSSKKSHVWLAAIFGLFLFLLLPNPGFAKQPESSYWYPEQLLKWTPEKDPNASFNRSQLPLAKREVLYKVNDHAQSDAKLVALSALNPNTSGVPSQGGKDFFANTFSYWQYVDLMVYWAGSAGEGIIVPPSADVIDAAHKNGVPILGNIFFPPTVYGGKTEWVNQMLTQREDGSFPAADKLLDVANYYGFDGWFINQETEGGNAVTAQKMQQFLGYLQKHKQKDMHIMWYDSMTNDGRINWQNALTDKNSSFLQNGNTRVSDSMFLNFWWRDQQASSIKAQELGRSSYDLFTGIDVEAKGTDTNVAWQGIFPEGKSPLTSLGIYRPDWAFKTAENMEQFYQKENEFWVGKSGNPVTTNENGSWKGMAHYFTAKTAIEELPFVTHFNTGSGKFFAVDGQTVREQSWNNRSLQDILPTWRWLKEGGQGLNVDFDWNTAYYGGSSLKLSGSIEQDNPTYLKLYKTNLSVQKDTEIALTYKTDLKKPNMKLGVSFTDHPDDFVFFDVKKHSHQQWMTDSFKLKKYSGKRIAALSLFIESDRDVKDFTANIGEIKVYNKQSKHNDIHAPKQGEIDKVEFAKGIYADATLGWEPVADSDVSHYEIYRKLPNNDKEFVGATPNHVYYLSNLRRSGKESSTELEIVAVNKEFKRSEPETVTFEWPPYPKPEADFRADKTVAAPGEGIHFFNTSSEVTEEVEWQFEGGTPSVSTENNPVVTYDKEGVYAVTLIAKNSEGESVLTKKGMITISEAAKDIQNVALKKTAVASGQCAPGEAAQYAFDGTFKSKWCALGDAPHWLKVDLGGQYSISKFVIHHAEAGGEPQAFNTRGFRIEVSTDGETWSEAVKVTDNAAAVSEHSISLATARYVRLWTDKPTQGGDQAARIYEFEVYGFPAQ
ncbi:endo-beta-N-acetylglucosaminidase [Fictibacillus solisalsi]|uniref:Endo-beta-N-acetylglucosaminidase n=1 Tax=Fictibacillus solisalsi TaxID=459525 RepID=A0A1G9YGS4_9BACL|nr:discoidin domain-containing protein [Fictibacillus solisalsi]SDN08344.1 endo-beta-N-acetylglucosaminidase [Fictibacillus solisalsi]